MCHFDKEAVKFKSQLLDDAFPVSVSVNVRVVFACISQHAGLANIQLSNYSPSGKWTGRPASPDAEHSLCGTRRAKVQQVGQVICSDQPCTRCRNKVSYDAACVKQSCQVGGIDTCFKLGWLICLVACVPSPWKPSVSCDRDTGIGKMVVKQARAGTLEDHTPRRTACQLTFGQRNCRDAGWRLTRSPNKNIPQSQKRPTIETSYHMRCSVSCVRMYRNAFAIRQWPNRLCKEHRAPMQKYDR